MFTLYVIQYEEWSVITVLREMVGVVAEATFQWRRFDKIVDVFFVWL